MPDQAQTPKLPAPRWDGRRVLFEVLDQDRLVPCAISMNALQDMDAVRRFKPADLMKSFAALRARIEVIALDKHRARSETATSLLNIWSDDIDDAQPSAEDAPAATLPEPEAPDVLPVPVRPATGAGFA